MGFIGVRLPDELKAKLEELAQADRRTLSSFVRLILEDWIAAREGEAPAKPGGPGKSHGRK